MSLDNNGSGNQGRIDFSLNDAQIIVYKLGSIESKLDAALSAAAAHQEADLRIQGDFEARIKGLETGKARMVGALAVVTLLFNGAVTFLKTKGFI